MEKRHRELLRRHTLILQKDLQPKKLLPYMVSVFDTEDEQKIKKQLTSTDQAVELLDILPKKGPDAFSCFVEALEDVQPHLAVALRAEEELEKRIIEIKAELASARCDSAKLRDQLCSTSANYNLEREKEKKLRKELEELKRLYNTLLLNGKREDMKCNELNNSKRQLAEQLELEKTNLCALEKELENKTEEMEKLEVDISNREVNKNIEVVHGQCDEILERMQQIADIVKFQQFEQQVKSYEKKPTHKMEKYTDTLADAEIQPCSNCIKPESESGELQQQIMQKEISRLNKEKMEVECALEEMTDKYEKEITKLNMTSKQDHDNEIRKDKYNEMTEQHVHLNDVEEIKKANEDLESQVKANDRAISRLKSELEGEKNSNRAVRKEFDKYKRKSISISEKNKMKKNLEDEIESKGLCLKKVETDLEEAKKESKVTNSKLSATMLELQDIQKQLNLLKEESTRWRKMSGRVFNYQKDFDRNGIIHFLGTSFNTKTFVNPASQDNCRMIVSRSSCDKGHPMDILDLKKASLSCTKDVVGSWWQVDFGEKHALFATHYTLRHGRDKGLSIIRNWNLEGSHDGRHWKVLRNHDNDHGMKGPDEFPFYTGSWTVEGQVEAMRYFLIKQTGKNSSGRHALYLSGFEIYGVLLDIS